MFSYDQAVLDRYPAVRAGVVHASGLTNGPTPPALWERYRTAQKEVADRLATTPPSQLPPIAAWRRAFAGFGAKPTQYRSAAEALLRRLAKQGDIPSINALVDLGNLVSIRHALPVAVVDLAGIDGGITVRFATGAERFTDLGADEPVAPEPGEVVFVDRAGVACARRWCWRQSAQSATRESTTDALVVVEGLHDAAERDVAAAREEIVALLAEFQPGATVTAHALP
ncbi:MAG TPA: phenylalanine--tRNA ligase beta subunit-related protein [Pseudonocardia sp.]|uniref:B3/B4 domain-containing protein n=1 Tax=Pseudonocardia sp. TaxID=60912 RepID=UPI002B4B6332|nr:phenylalanine--tRNA ligase beta subunit-related protein [Pseudonocardia sp.]HLU58454.1 phenylalanine--tRNA ligase beta subunit-related protein [Pseudonocardia sp.]